MMKTAAKSFKIKCYINRNWATYSGKEHNYRKQNNFMSYSDKCNKVNRRSILFKIRNITNVTYCLD